MATTTVPTETGWYWITDGDEQWTPYWQPFNAGYEAGAKGK